MGKHKQGKGRRPRTVRADALTPEQRAALSPNVVVLDPVAPAVPTAALSAPPAEPVRLTVRVTLDHTTPPVWRRLTLPGSLDLGTLHHVLQIAMGWEGEHLHQFGFVAAGSGDEVMFLTPDDVARGLRGIAESGVRVDQVLHVPGDALSYLYDFGDGWEHTVRLEEVRPLVGVAGGGVVCLEGARACPPEDIGGPYVYTEIARWVRGGRKQGEIEEVWDPDDLSDWLGDWDPDALDLDAVNRALARVRVE